MAKKTQILNIRLPDEIILELDNLVKKKIFKSRSEAIREFARQYVQEQEKQNFSWPSNQKNLTEQHMHITEEDAKQSGRGGGR